MRPVADHELPDLRKRGEPHGLSPEQVLAADLLEMPLRQHAAYARIVNVDGFRRLEADEQARAQARQEVAAEKPKAVLALGAQGAPWRYVPRALVSTQAGGTTVGVAGAAGLCDLSGGVPSADYVTLAVTGAGSAASGRCTCSTTATGHRADDELGRRRTRRRTSRPRGCAGRGRTRCPRSPLVILCAE